MALICRLVGHRRSRKRARLFAGSWVSRCRFCDERLVRLGPRQWVVQPGILAAETEAPLPLFDRERC